MHIFLGKVIFRFLSLYSLNVMHKEMGEGSTLVKMHFTDNDLNPGLEIKSL